MPTGQSGLRLGPATEREVVERMKGIPGQVIAACFAMCAFATAVLSGLAAGNEAGTILVRALVLMVVCYGAGLIIGMMCEAAVRRQLDDEEPEMLTQMQNSAESAPPASGEVVDNDEVFVV